MIIFPNAKINLGLHILGKRNDGYHDIETIFYPVKWCDALEAIPAQNFSFETHGLKIYENGSDNLCVKAFHLLQQEYRIAEVKMCLLKNIPMGAGLGGGSSDAAFTLKLINDLFQLQFSLEQLQNFASQLGSDCSFFILNQPCFASGKGNELKPIDLDLSSFHILIVYPKIHVDTGWAYSQLTPEKNQSPTGENDLIHIIHQPVSTWKENLKNDFEEIVFAKHPSIGGIKKQLYEYGALYASMSGSGSAVFGIFEKEPPVNLFSAHQCFRGTI